ncbi:minor tail protein [Gordonia phage DumpTruck]|nr:minor tail protein [Gordonia phage DumpTruck]
MPEYMTREQRALRGISNRSEKPNKDLEKNIQNLNQSVRYMSQMMGVMQSGIDDANRDILQQFGDAIEDLMIIFNIGGGGDTLNLDWGDLGVVLDNIASIFRFDFLNLPDFDLLGWAQDVWDSVFGQLDIIPSWDDLRKTFIGAYAGGNIVLNFIQNLFAPVRRVVKMFTGKALWEDATPAEVDQFSDDLKAALSGGTPSSGGQLNGANAIQQIANNINALGEGVAEGVEEAIQNVHTVIGNIFGTANNAQTKAVEAQTALQNLINQNEGAAAGGRSGQDNFDRANATTLGSGWVSTVFGNSRASITNQMVNFPVLGAPEDGGALVYHRWAGEVSVGDFFQSTIVYGTSFSNSGSPVSWLFNRWDGQFAPNSDPLATTPLNCWAVRIVRSGGLTLYRIVNGVMTSVGTSDVGTISTGDVISLRCGSLAGAGYISVVFNGQVEIAPPNDTLGMIGPAYRYHGFSGYAHGVPFLGWQQPASVASYNWSDIPGGGIIQRNGFRYARTSAASTNQVANAQVPASTFQTLVMSEGIKPPAGTTYDAGRGEFVVTKEGWWNFTFGWNGWTLSISANAAVKPTPVLFYGQGALSSQYQLAGPYLRQGTSSGRIEHTWQVSLRKYCLVGERVAPGWGGTRIDYFDADAAGQNTFFSGSLEG